MRHPVVNKQDTRHESFENLALPMMDELYGYALRMSKNPTDAEDLVQETYLRAYRFFDSFEIGTNFRAWIFRILHNNFIDVFKRKKREDASVELESNSPDVAHKSQNPAISNMRTLQLDYTEIFDDAITRALDKLPTDYRLVVLLSDVNGLKYKEIANIIRRPIGTVMSRLSRARKMLAKSLKPSAREYGILRNTRVRQTL
ncbi:sigma-70 family RNA polymerase sigma factor [candidate division KSB1 bacterium]|nr:sigma-70 family RNA polymerase sigma factor [candidate division KSB1 bacterium]NIR69877.1 sigma-70 family RNA polymerase sigma factor [candidate division KSB1 bacterium]NIS28030.1 sigma-70 family RNA polymerase sigma factor [candidate division KSB1 bacterium]NIT74901.1 sigma-70 family RNA polymerase sigma factor [candidate division KSB1 bacterium]NIU28685.1 sigma-70 family RNA polymerase sigma factor [candidate division KSB1 bacterium]